ncbi:RNA 2'-phosphotransferase [Neolewinella persica]|uniref:RNA 2'-phosphotransferase n=1 Tax=Neolewinella persica TaxID=70998 RepID=UPI0003A078A3|nr:RNA 2'-phosphotransferase [Neolewinella persica]
MDPRKIKRASRKISLVLRHQPEAIGITLDKNGWAKVSELLSRMSANGYPMKREDLTIIVRENDKKRFSFSADGRKIRANQGHSIDVDLQLEATPPPSKLFHGTATTSVESILKSGLKPQKRQHVHLSVDLKTAAAVGSRHGRPVILEIDAAGMARDGYEFYCSVNGVWLAGGVPVEYLSVNW